MKAKIKTIKLSDVKLLLHLFAPKNYTLIVNDPDSKLIVDSETTDLLHKLESTKPIVLINFANITDVFIKYPSQKIDFIIDFSNNLKLSNMYKIKRFGFINNPDKSMRWVFFKDNYKATFLNFFNSASPRAKFYKRLIYILSFLKMNKLFSSGEFSFYYTNNLKIEETLKNIPFESYSIFTGTVGLNRKLLLELNTKGKTTHFVKVALNSHSLTLIQNEKKILHNLSQKQLTHTVIPSIVEIEEPAICVTTNINKPKAKQLDKFSEIHFAALNELYQQNLYTESFSQSSLYGKIDSNIKQLKHSSRFKESKVITRNLESVFNQISKTQHILFAYGHTDFTPWNMYVQNEKLHTYDWEMAHGRVPVLFDLFHFIFQSNILLKQKDIHQIKTEIDAALNIPAVQRFIITYAIDVELYYNLYLLQNISYYMNLYEAQPALHKQVYWLVRNWNSALAASNKNINGISQRKIFIKDFFETLSPLNYAALKLTGESIDSIKDSSDIDLLILKRDLKEIIDFSKNCAFAKKVKVLQKSFMSTVELFFNDGSFLSIDLIHTFKRKAAVMLKSEKFLRSAVKNSFGLSVADKRFDFEYILLFYILNNSKVPERYQQQYSLLTSAEKESIKNSFFSSYKIKSNDFEELFNGGVSNKNTIQEIVSQLPENKGLQRLKNIANYCVDSLKELFGKRGVVISFSGVDGAGKTTIINMLSDKLSTTYRRKVVVLRHRPSLFPILSSFKHGKSEAQRIAATHLPHSGNNKSMLSSFFRFAYYFTDYIVGQPILYFKYILRGYVVIYDRYYFDFIGDSKRSNITLPKGLTKSLYRFIYKPKINVFLYASPDEILKRKQELDSFHITEMTNAYKALFSEYSKKYSSSKYVQIENIDILKTENILMNEYLSAA